MSVFVTVFSLLKPSCEVRTMLRSGHIFSRSGPSFATSLRGAFLGVPDLGFSAAPFSSTFFGGGFPSKIYYRKELVPTYSSLSSGGPSDFEFPNS